MAGETYFELGRVKVVDVQRETAAAVPELSCNDFVLGDIAIPFVERQPPVFRVVTLDRLAVPNGKTVGRILMANDFDTMVGSKYAVYLNVGEDKGIKVGDYFRATRTYSYSYHESQGVLTRSASTNEDNQIKPQKLPVGELSSLPRRTLGDMIVLQVHKRSSTALILTALEDIHVGDGVEMMDVSGAPEVQAVLPASATEPSSVPGAVVADTTVTSPPKITCTAAPSTVRVGESSIITCDASSPDNRPIALTFVTNGGKLSTSRNQATLDTADAGPGPIAVRATAFDDRQLNATAVTTVTVESATPPPLPTAQKLSELEFKPGSAYVDNRSKAILDDVALKLQQDPGSTAVLSGSADEKEPPRMASQRAENAKTYLSKSKGIDAQRLQTKTSTEPGRKVEIWTVPAGAAAPK
jgi:outer membrane protein OmpA-like peptidoglycan-associated protein